MSKTRQVLHFVDFGKEYKVIKYYGEVNPYRIYHLYTDIGKNGFPVHHKKLMESYCSLEGCFYWFLQNGIGRT